MSLPVLRSADFAHLDRYQLWTDALCFREMARQAPSNYLRTMCVRSAVIAAWTTLEMASRDALGVQRLGTRGFQAGLNDQLANQGKPKVDFGSGAWQLLVNRTLKRRNEYAHIGARLTDRFQPESHSDEAIIDVRSAVRLVYQHVGKVPPAWIEHDMSSGWPHSGGRMIGTATVIRQSANPEDPATIKIALLKPGGEEQPIEYLGPATLEEDILGAVEDILGKLNAPFVGIRVYRGQTLIHDEPIEVRG